jgi:hypothetical protein
MPAPVSAGWLRAVAQAFPFASQASFGLAETVLKADESAKMWRGALDDLRSVARGAALSTLRGVLHEAWFDGFSAHVTLFDHLSRVAGEVLESRGNFVEIRSLPSICTAVSLEQWRWVTMELPPDLLVAAVASDPVREERPSLLSRSVRGLLEREVAETHLHQSAATDFAHVWLGVVVGVRRGTVRWEDLPDDDVVPFGDVEALRHRIAQACVVRWLLAAFLSAVPRHRENAWRSVWERVEERYGERDASRLRAVVRAVSRGRDDATTRHGVESLLVLLTPRPREPRSLRELREADPISPLMGLGPALPETTLARAAFTFLREQADASAFARLFWQYQRIRCLLYRFLTQRPGVSGLDWFTRHYDRIGGLTAPIDRLMGAAALELEGRHLGLDSIELRAQPPSQWSKARDKVVTVIEAPKRRYRDDCPEREPERGLVFHFIKERLADGVHEHADPGYGGTGFRFARWYVGARRRALALVQLFAFHPEALHWVRGVDVANHELAAPSWVIGPLYALVRAAADSSIRSAPAWCGRLSPLHATFHCGEEFRTLNEGLRRIHELTDFGILRSSDRVGHGLALATSVDAWEASRQYAVQPTEERLLDLVWELDLYRKGRVPCPAGRWPVLTGEIDDLMGRVYGRGARAADLVVARRLQHDPRVLDALGFPVVPRAPAHDPVLVLVYRNLTDRHVYQRGRVPLRVTTTAPEKEFLKAAALMLRRELGRLEITIEMNPSSNLIVGDLGTMGHHPYIGLGNWDGEAPGIALSVNDDDPITFATSLDAEYAYAYAALLEKVGAARALEIVGQIRAHGWRSRFTVPASRDPRRAARLCRGPP